jgi:hypothetical protein
MDYLPDKSGQEYIDYLREDTDVTVMGTSERVSSFFNPQAEHWTEPMYPTMDMLGSPLQKPLSPTDEWTRHIAVLVSSLAHIMPLFENPYDSSGALDSHDLVRFEIYNQILGFKNAPQGPRSGVGTRTPSGTPNRNAPAPGASEFIAR